MYRCICIFIHATSHLTKGNGNRPLHIAAQNGHTDIVRLLVNKKCRLNETNQKGNTAIHMAIGYDYYDAAKLIIDAGGDPKILNLAGEAFFLSFFLSFTNTIFEFHHVW